MAAGFLFLNNEIRGVENASNVIGFYYLIYLSILCPNEP